MTEQKVFFQNSKGDKLAGILATPSESTEVPVVIICHGFTSNKNRLKYVDLAKILSGNNIASLRFDFFGHGESEGDFADITITEGVDDILQSIEFVKSRGYKKIALVGTSFGGQTSFVAATKTDDLTALALVSPVSDYPEVEKRRRSDENITEWKRAGYAIHKSSKGIEYRLNYSFWEDIQKYIVYNTASQIKIPTLIIHGDADERVPIEQSRKTAKLIPNCKLIEIKGADHKYSDPSHCGQMITEISDFAIEELTIT